MALSRRTRSLRSQKQCGRQDAEGVGGTGTTCGGGTVQGERPPRGGSSPLAQMPEHPAASLSELALLRQNRRDEGGAGREGDRWRPLLSLGQRHMVRSIPNLRSGAYMRLFFFFFFRASCAHLLWKLKDTALCSVTLKKLHFGTFDSRILGQPLWFEIINDRDKCQNI